jgi:oxysterol-binding protein-related protein 8
MYARGILFGKMILELGDTCQAQCVANDIVADLDFKTKVPLATINRYP